MKTIRTEEDIAQLVEDCNATERTNPNRAAYSRGIRAVLRWLKFETEPYPLADAPVSRPVVIDGRDFTDGSGD